MKHSTDIDLDFADRQLILDKISNVLRKDEHKTK